MKSVPGFRPVNRMCVLVRLRRLTETGSGKEDKHACGGKNSFAGKKIICGPRDRQDSDCHNKD